MTLKLTQTGDPVLRHPARTLTRDEILSQEIQDVIAAMFDAVRAAPGVGLAAPQVGIGLQIAVIEDRAEYIAKMPTGHAQERGRVPVPAHVIINPHLEIEHGESVAFFEGCLSLPGFTAVVPRARRVRVDCLNEKAEAVTIHAEGWYARILQHEIDHLHGTLYIDRMKSRSFMTRERFEADWKDLPVPETLARLLS